MVYNCSHHQRASNRLGELINERLEWIKQRGYEVEIICERLDDDTDSLIFRLYLPDRDEGVFRIEDITYIYPASTGWGHCFETYRYCLGIEVVVAGNTAYLSSVSSR